AEARTALAVAEHDIASLTEALGSDARRRQTAVDALEAVAGTELLSVAHPELVGVEPGVRTVAEAPSAGGDPQGSWSVDRAVRTARRIAHLLADVVSDDLAWQRSQRGIHGHLQTLIDTLLPHGYEPSATLVDQVLVVTVPFQGRTCSMTQLRDALADEVASRQSILDAREREVLENHLIGEVSAHLHDLLRAGEQWVTQVNTELAANPMSTGMALRFAWRPAPDAPNGLPEARTRLLRAGGTWSPTERQALGAFLQEQIRAVRAANDTGTWSEHLAVALDYRTWHAFDIERRQDGDWKRLTRRTHGTGSGGEKAIALTLPQFAAAAAHYRSADPHAPRLILLDEAFVGVDADMRSKCMGLLAAFDLDFVMTSEREWGCYATLPGVAICQLATRPGIDAVGMTRWVWNGQQRVRADVTPAPAAPPTPVGRDEQPQLA
ncbi:MAG: SbcC/MukB-like Walker B domain-containing protein, partial [Egibacteraceae bacterium]